jgi:hypothetical protein
MTPTRGGLLLGAGLALGIALGAAGSALAASPSPAGGTAPAADTPWSGMLGGWGGGMMGGWASNVAPSASFGPGMMGSLDPSQRAAVLEACDEAHDAMHAWASGEASPAPSTR